MSYLVWMARKSLRVRRKKWRLGLVGVCGAGGGGGSSGGNRGVVVEDWERDRERERERDLERERERDLGRD